MKAYSNEQIEEILKDYGDMIYRMAYMRVKSKEVAEDVYQDVCIKLLKQKKKIDGREYLKAWLLRTTINCCKDYWKSSWIQKISLGQDEQMNGKNSVTEENETEWGYVTECVLELPEKYRTVIHLYYYEELSQKEIAKLLGKKENTIASQLSRAREMLRKKLEIKNKEEWYYGIQESI